MLSTLTEREQKILIFRFGLRGEDKKTYSEISEDFNLTRERIRQIEIKTIGKLRLPDRRVFLEGYFE